MPATRFSAFSLTNQDVPVVCLWGPDSKTPVPNVELQSVVTDLVVDHFGPSPVVLPSSAAVACMRHVETLRVIADAAVLEGTCYPTFNADGLVRFSSHLPALRRVELVARAGQTLTDPTHFVPLQERLPRGVKLCVGPSSASRCVHQHRPEAAVVRDILSLELRLTAMARSLARMRALAQDDNDAESMCDIEAALPALKRQRC